MPNFSPNAAADSAVREPTAVTSLRRDPATPSANCFAMLPVPRTPKRSRAAMAGSVRYRFALQEPLMIARAAAVLLLFASSACVVAQSPPEVKEIQAEQVAAGFAFTEGPTLGRDGAI